MSRFAKLDELFTRAIELDAAAREELLEDAARTDSVLADELRALLRAHFETAGSFLSSPDAPLAAGRTLGPFRIERVLATGGMGAVYVATQESPRRAVALKVMRAGILAPSAAKRFRHEAEILGRLRHPGIAQVFEAGAFVDGGCTLPWLAMELVPDALAMTEFARRRALSRDARLRLFAKVCDAVQHGHQRGVIHRDLKPGNILVDGQGEPKVIDFGVARVADADDGSSMFETRLGQIVGTLAYMSPEQCRGDPRELDVRSDVYSLGVLLYELVCDRLPIDVERVALPEALRRVQEQPPARPRPANPAVSDDLEAVLFKALEKERERRYASASELGADVRRLLAHEPVLARPTTFTYHFRLFARRNKALVAAVAAGALVLVVAAIVNGWLAWQNDRLAKQAKGAADDATARANEAEAARRREHDERVIADETATLLRDLFVMANPVHAGRDLTVREALDDAARRLDTGLPRAPQVEVRLRIPLAESYRNLGRFDEAEAQARRALALLDSIAGDMRLARAALLNTLGAIASAREELAAAEAACSEALALYGAADGDDPAGHADLLGNFAFVRRRQTRWDEAQRMSEEALTLRRSIGDPLKLAETLNNHGNLLFDRNDLDGAGTSWEEACDLYAKHDEEHPYHAAALANLGWIRQRRGMLDEAGRLYARSLAIREERLGPDHADVASTLLKIAHLAAARGELDEADAGFARAIDVRRRALGGNSPLVAAALADRASLRLAQERNADAVALLDEAIAIQRAALPPKHLDLGGPLLLMGLARIRAGDPEDAEAPLRESVEIREAALGAAHWQAANARSVLGECLLELGRLDEADPLVRDALPILRAALGPGHAQTKAAERRVASLDEALAR
jgi:tetratricopeptide (TPR) repeat protein